ncbi:heavy-metal-associated domain-containing protein [Agrobacterium rosae]|uniref:Heavy-metal-associated domain-containing protein n=1 Tax=Agrobacterium rosae TaxID=1972867 RepID=A0AAW9FFM0_9HYPH|nr:heavy-metal-associated domain-containing protein [Agrobacterium rosae]MDX8303233.1 heavy-metal-associated domain-containing protein [Agrobacterium rosae]POO56300.1 heavy metal transporter [Agrobacterium rosae]
MTTTTFTVPDMTCGHCEKTIRVALTEALPNAEIGINLSIHRVTITGNAAMAEEAMREVGYSPERLG